MDRERLKEVHQSDLVEGRINQEFLDWLRTKGVTWLMFVLLALCAYFGVVRWKQYRENYQAEAWATLTNLQAMPSDLEDAAEKYKDVGALPHLVRLRAAEQLLSSVQIGKTLGTTAEERQTLTEEERADYLRRADGYYQKVAEADDGSPNMTLLIASALTGRASVAEAQGDLDSARQFYTQVAERTKDQFPAIAARATARAENIERQAQAVTLRTMLQNQAINTPPTETPERVTAEPWLEELLMPKDDAAQ